MNKTILKCELREMIHVVWFKRDLRIFDHQPLIEATKHGEPVLPIYVAEPSVWNEPDLSIRHFQFVRESLEELSEHLLKRGGTLYVAIAEIEEVLKAIYEQIGAFSLYAHEENGTPFTYERDKRVHKWMNEHGLTFKEYQAFGVKRGLKDRKHFNKNWHMFMESEVIQAPKQIQPVPEGMVPTILTQHLQKLSDFSVKGQTIRFGQQGGERKAHETLTTFLQDRFQTYNVNISKPLQSSVSCSRLSPYLAWGNISIRYVVQKTMEAVANCSNDNDRKQLEAFASRLHWHCQFIQRIEDEPKIASKTMNLVFDEVRQEWNEEYFQRWLRGETGIPMIDAAMRCLHKTGWIHFQSRAMLVSFICNTLLMDWRKPALALAQLFLDYEPGIHFSQMQMQAGTAGFNAIRIYNPIKLGIAHDANGAFIRRYVHELKTIPDKYVHEPWNYLGFFQLGYPSPIVDIQKANRKAREILSSVKKAEDPTTSTQIDKQGSQKKQPQKKHAIKDGEQLEFDLFS